MREQLEKALQATISRIDLKTIPAEQNLQSLILEIEYILNPKLSEGRKND